MGKILQFESKSNAPCFEHPLRILILENPFQNWLNPEVPDIFKNIILLKRLGYDGYYPHGFLPLDTGDLVATHLLVCEETPDGLIPVVSYRSLSFQQCTHYHLPFPALSALLKDEATEQHIQAIHTIIASCLKNNRKLTFSSGWTIHPKMRSDREKADYLKDVTRAMFYSYEQEFGQHEEIGFGVPKVKTNFYFSGIGYEPIKNFGRELPPVAHVDIDGDAIVVMHRVHFTELARVSSLKHQRLWLEKIVLDNNPKAIKKIV